ncbi:MAG: extracellular solute-binding protein [Lachnospiraceae bacterium]|nr:extracellular solute-binding protein [Lachnospiraceae bacterium]
MSKYRYMWMGMLAVIVLWLGGCGSKRIEFEEFPGKNYAAIALPLDGMEMKEEIAHLYSGDEEIFFDTLMMGKEPEEGNSRFHFYQYSWMNQRPEELPISLDSGEGVVKLTGIDSKELALLLQREEEYTIATYDTNGTCLFRKSVTEFVNQLDNTIVSFKMDQEHRFYCIGVNRIFIFDETGEMVHSLETDGVFGDCFKGEDGKIYVEDFDGKTTAVYEITLDKQSRKKYADPVGEEEEWNKSRIGNCVESVRWDYIQMTQEALIGVNLRQRKAKCLLNWQDTGVNPEKLGGGFCEISENAYAAICYDEAGERSTQLLLICPVAEEGDLEEESKVVITMAGLQIPSFLKDAAYRFNQTSAEYKVEFKDYQGDASKLNAALMQGGMVDLLCMEGLSKEHYLKQGSLCDLNTFLANSTVIKKDDLQEIVYQMLTDEQGRLYSWTPGFVIEAVMGDRETVGEQQASLEAIQQMQSGLDEGMELYYGMDTVTMFRNLMQANLQHFITPDGSHCSFQKDDFFRLLQLAETFGTVSDEDEELSMPQKVQNGQVVYVGETISDFLDIMFYDRMFGGKPAFPGYPAYDNPGNFFSCYGMETAIVEQSEHKEGAWAYLEYLTSKEYLMQYCRMSFFPVRKDCIDEYINIMSATQPYVDSLGIQHPAYHGVAGYDDYEVELGALTQGQISEFRTLLDHLYMPPQLEAEAWDVITEETGRYFAKEISKEQCAKNLEERMALYLEE